MARPSEHFATKQTNTIFLHRKGPESLPRGRAEARRGPAVCTRLRDEGSSILDQVNWIPAPLLEAAWLCLIEQFTTQQRTR